MLGTNKERVKRAMQELEYMALFKYIQTSILDIRLLLRSEDKWQGDPNDDHISTNLRNAIEAIGPSLAPAPRLSKVEVAWMQYTSSYTHDTRAEALEPLLGLGKLFRLVVREETEHQERSRSDMDEADWPDMLKLYRPLEF